MTIDEAISRYESNAEYERTHESLQGCLEFRQLAAWLKDYKRLLGVIEDIKNEIEQHCNITVGSDNEPAMTLHDIFGILDKHISRKENE